MNKLINFAPERYHEGLYGAMFIGPAIFLLGLFLLYPAIRTIYLSFFDKRGNNFIGLENYVWSFSDRLMLITIRNQVIWLIGVVSLVILFGLVVGYISDRLKKGEAFFKSVIFMPMAISAVGSSAIFKFIYEYRPPPLTQIGLINGIRVGIGNDVNGNECGNNVILNDGSKLDYVNDGCLRPIGWIQQRDLTNLPSFENISSGDFFLNLFVNFPINTVLLMLVMVWMFTGFAMVVFSAAIKAIPTEIIEAGQIDGASEGKIFMSIVIPYLKTTILVVATYMTVSVLKAFDIIYVTTRGDFETNLLAVKMLDEFAKFLNQGRSAAVAVIIFISVIPIIILNLIRNRSEAKS
tara:strand:- start:1373 stop:2422 length:1050 start_codon:yes stop_codon:yes gene_type:complete